MGSNQKQLSIIVPVYKVEDYLEECLKSIYQLEGIEFEVIIVDDGSPDESYVIYQRYEQLYPNNTVIVKRENGGLSAARNSGLAEATGEFVALVDSDDYICATSLKQLLSNAIAENLDIAIANTTSFWQQNETCFLPMNVPENVIDLPICKGTDFLEQSFLTNYRRVNCWNKIYKNSFLKEYSLNFVEKILFEDVPFTFEAFLLAKRVKAYDLEYYFYRQRPGSIMTSSGQLASPDRITVVRLVMSLLATHQYQGKAFDDYLVFQIWENACGTANKHTKLCVEFMKRFKLSFKGWVRLLTIVCGIPKILSQKG